MKIALIITSILCISLTVFSLKLMDSNIKRMNKLIDNKTKIQVYEQLTKVLILAPKPLTCKTINPLLDEHQLWSQDLIFDEENNHYILRIGLKHSAFKHPQYFLSNAYLQPRT